jgi:hypothetical protein
LSVSSQGVVFHSTSDPEFNTSAPTGSLAASGWQYQGRWGSYLGTVISSNAFLTARHVGIGLGNAFVLDNTPYTSVAFFDDPASDLRIVRVCGRFASAAPLHTNQTELGKPLVVFGRGTQRGTPVTTGPAGEKLHGWRWGTADQRLRWGENNVDAIVDGNALFGAGVGDLLKVSFSAGAGPNECHLSNGDSAGAVFILDGSWQLAGINFAVDGPYSTSPAGPGFEAAIFDEGGLYRQNLETWMLTPDLPFEQAGAFYATRIAARIDWILFILQQIDTHPDPPALQSAPAANGPFTDDSAATVDPAQNLITIAQPAGPRFYRLRGCRSFQIVSITLVAGSIRIHYE